MLTKTTYLAIGAALLTQLTSADYKDTVRHTELVDELNLRGDFVPTGTGVSVTQVEGTFDPTDPNVYHPDTANSEFSGKTITDVTGTGTTSSHATTVGKNLYGNTTSIAPSITAVDIYLSTDWLNNEGWRTGTPSESNPLQNHSWVNFTSSQATTLRMDYAVEQDGFLPVAGLYNSDYGDQDIPNEIPEIYGSMYNGISIGVSDGTHRTGTTSSTDGAGRTKPEIVAPNDYTSFATPYVTAAAALLIESAGSDTAAKDQLTLKAILLAGADKSPFTSWDQTTARPIDDIYGAGQLDVYENYFIQQAGQQANSSPINTRGWNLANLTSNATHDYPFTIPAGFKLRNLSALLTWNREVERKESGWGPFKTITYTPTLADLSLTLTNNTTSTTVQTSNSAVDNIEHIWRDSSNALPAGSYTFTVTVATDIAAEYAIAWRSELYQDYTLWSSAQFTEATPSDQRAATDDPDADGIANQLEQAFGGDPEVNDLTILPIHETVQIASATYLQISYRKPDFDNGLTYTVETVTDLNGTWTSAASEVELISIGSETGGYDRYTYRLVTPISAEQKAFLRVSITQ